MNLSEWQKNTGVSNGDLSKILGVHFSYITHLNANRRRPSPELALKIQQATGGQVTVMELLFPNQTNPTRPCECNPAEAPSG